MQSHSKLRQSILSSIVAVAMVGTLSFAPALASAQQESQDLTIGTMSAGVPEWAVDDGGDAQEGALTAQAAIPETYDLRAEGLVTPVKQQGPWGSCWAFGGTAAAETSIMSAYGSTYEKSKLDLSEKHLTYFALQPVSESDNPAQAGEGLHTLDTSANAPYDAGGLPIYITTLYSQGVGPMSESLFPYRGKEGITTSESYEAHPEYLDEETREQITELAAGYNMTYDQFMEASATAMGITVDEFFERNKSQIRQSAIIKPSYSKHDDWSIPATNADGASNRLVSSGVVLKNGNVLPTYWTGGDEPNVTCTDAIKQELLNGRGVSIGYYADDPNGLYSAEPGAAPNGNTNQNQYVYAAGTGQNHGVCIVGWDDAYAKENFTHGDSAEAQAATTPPADGAWIVKNSWGSETDATEENADDLGNVMNKGTFGNQDGDGKATGFFYLSYFDKSITKPESMEFSASLGSEGSFAALQYDYMPANFDFFTMPASSDIASSANVFAADGADIAVKSVSTRTSEANTRVTFAIYKLNDGATGPTDGEMLYRTSQNFAYGGFHRLDLDKPITFTAGTKFSVVSTASTVDNTGKRSYSVSANRGFSKAAAEEYRANHPGAQVNIYSTAVVNKGESYLYDGKEWKDWGEYLAALPANGETRALLPSEDSYTKACPVDNFSIKVYAEPVDNSQAVALEEAQKAQKEAEEKAAAAEKAKKAAEEKAASLVKANTMTVEAKKITAKANKKTTFKKAKAFTVKNAEGTVTFYKVSGNAKITVSSKGDVTVKKGLAAKDGYKVKVLVTAAGGKVGGVSYAPIHKTVTLTVKVTKAANPIALAKKTITVEYAKLKKAKQTVAIKKATKAQGKVTYSITKAVKGKKSFKAKFKIAKKTGKITVAKSLKKGTYKVTVKAKAAGNASYKSGYKTAVVTIKVK